MYCKTCGGDMHGDGFKDVLHCENVDVIGEGYAPDDNPVYCKEAQELAPLPESSVKQKSKVE